METGGEWRMRVRDRGGDRWGVENESERGVETGGEWRMRVRE